MTSPTTQSDVELREQIQNVLIKSHMYEQFNTELRSKLLQDGWIDRVKKMAIDEIMKQDGGSATDKSFSDILSAIEGPALNDVPEDIKTEMLSKFKSFLNDVVE
ncbi:hypothetical protein ACO0RG_003545 [Hanseniaspora osmophila]|mgnify:CR=1 FL=1|uniref:Transcription and mRNA export factor SUS1 n=1 Tax=Hanseniaspora osmophila TaxID=56408 RepID=A0A1E5RFF2_9ASCO|nr:Transcription and mRNA export factor SUS1 [Hanseniaspora osmophila]